jgi:hypothetical protein
VVVEVPSHPLACRVAVVENCVLLPIQHGLVGAGLAAAVAACSIAELEWPFIRPLHQTRKEHCARQSIEAVAVCGHDEPHVMKGSMIAPALEVLRCRNFSGG